MGENSASEIFYDRKGCRISCEQWERLIHDTEYRRIEFDQFDDFFIYTSWIGIDQGELDDPVIFMTYMGPLVGPAVCFYYSQEKMARKHHNMFTFMADQNCLHKFLEEKFL
jgi:hypothetical protein